MAAYIGFQPKDFYNSLILTGTGATRAVTGVGFQPDLVWAKCRSNGYNNNLCDAVRGVTKIVKSDSTAAETTDAQSLTAFGSDGFTLGTNTPWNGSGPTYVYWNWKGGTTSGITTDGSTTITPSGYSFSATSGFSIVQYSGNSTSGAKVAHGLGAVPEMIIVKTTNTANSWNIYQKGVDATAPEDYYMTFATDVRTDDSSRWNDTAPDSVNFTLGNAAAVNGSSNTMIAYCFAEKNGYSKFGSYVGNGNADGTFVYTGFRPAYFLLKRTDVGNDWVIMDNKINPYNLADTRLAPNSDVVESTSATKSLDILSNGVKIRTSDAEFNASGGTYIYAAFAEFPLVSSNSKPGTAR